ncbi:hypothetical protein J3R83DRAFT_5695 [Lanmaoa asiatica]|nr:hypothetical protein J3R83DRAFT_5695 [Lanmaoa asiatica]
MNTTNPAQSSNTNVYVYRLPSLFSREYAECESRAKNITIRNIELRTQARRQFHAAKQYHVQFSVGDTLRSTKNAKEKKNCTSWDDVFYFDGDNRTVVLAAVYVKHRIAFKQGVLVGSLTDTIGGMLEKLKNGGMKMFYMTMLSSTDAISVTKVLEVPLAGGTSDASEPSGITIKFALAAQPRGDANANELHATDAIDRATEVTSALAPTTQIVGLVDSAIDAGNAVVTEVQTCENTWGILLQRMAIFNKIVAGVAEIHPYVSLAWSVISAADQVLVNQQNRDDHIIRLAGKMSDVFAFVQDADPLKAVEAHRKTITLLLQQVTECGYFITEYAKQKNFWIQITDYENKLQELKTKFLEGVALQSGVTVFRMMNVVQNIAESIDLNDMPYAAGARYVQEKGCLPGTREVIIRDICNILNDPAEDAPRVCLLTGVAGAGKSAVAHSIARLYDEQKRLGSSYCFARSDVAKRNPQNVFSTISRDLSDHDVQFKSALWAIVKDNRALRTSVSPSEQIKQLIIEPSRDIHAIGPLIIVVDAIDESGEEEDRCQLLDALSMQITERNLPTSLRFLITTRPESDILEALPLGPHIIHRNIGELPQATIDEDIEKLIYHSLYRYTELESSWPNREWCRLLVQHSQGLFQWAVHGVQVHQGGDSVRPLDKLYHTILAQMFPSGEAQNRFRDVMAIVLALKEPLSLASLSTLFGDSPKVRNIIKPLGSMLKFNICDLKDSRLRNVEVPNLASRVTKAIPPHLAYSCQYWMHHMQDAQCTAELLDEVTSFFKNFFPFWLEAISLLSLSSPLSYILAAVETCADLEKWAKGHEIATFASDAHQFIQVHAPDTLHITTVATMGQPPSKCFDSDLGTSTKLASRGSYSAGTHP